MDDLVTWLRAQIAEDEKAARKRMHHAQENHLLLQDPKYLGRFIPGWHEWPEIEAAAAHVLVECEAHQRILDMYERHAGFWDTAEPDVRDRDYRLMNAEMDVCRFVLRALALAYQHRPGYRPEWWP